MNFDLTKGPLKLSKCLPNISNFTKGALIFIIYKLFDVDFFCNNRGLLNTHEKKLKIQGIYNLMFSQKN